MNERAKSIGAHFQIWSPERKRDTLKPYLRRYQKTRHSEHELAKMVPPFGGAKSHRHDRIRHASGSLQTALS